ncbi:guanine nucleotide binding protein, alpha subunit [Desarmillaria tabescens]|uniref:Guanine nucleotide binding protein, alpha subunit n=1 Tax=Armillaria tabescens TaxID=1929756 RepID=A0AA39TPQ2_ARMTA|nr:guanine nucleotide binding protein, alpha subunit [Desarmillaria tabescens]KAK0466227.1 guanine nucleotide binding protein, alpha subunit [Desarmillaria tabescens]
MAKNRTEAPNRRRSLSDPLAAALLPPANETPAEKELRLKRETEAKQVSDHIDEMIRQERIHRKKTRAEVNVLLLGQSESGKSTTLKQFQLLHTPAAFHAERIAWRAVIYLNLVRSIKRILDALSPESEIVEDHDDVDSLEMASVIISSNGRPPSAISGTKVPNYEIYRSRLEPLTELEERLIRLLSSPDEDEATHLAWQPFPKSSPPSSYPSIGNGRPAPTIAIPQIKPSVSSPVSPVGDISPGGSSGSQPSKGKEVSVHTSTNWKKAFALGGKSKSPKSAHSGEIEGWWEDPEDPVHALNACAPAMQELWKDPKVRQRLQEKRLRLEESSGFYLDEIPRITAKKYIPTDADVLKARLKTMGVVEHTFLIQSGSNRGVEWRIYDVGGARNQRQAWAPYFEDVNAIIFLAPISAFDQVLTEDPRVNRLEDSLLLWQAVTSNKLLAKVNIVLFLNKCDLLQAKLDAGVRLNHHMTSYGDRPNDYDSVSKYFRNKFGAIHHSATPNKERELYSKFRSLRYSLVIPHDCFPFVVHFTAVTDTRRTVTIISTVRDIIIKGNLRNLKLV